MAKTSNPESRALERWERKDPVAGATFMAWVWPEMGYAGRSAALGILGVIVPALTIMDVALFRVSTRLDRNHEFQGKGTAGL